jgi:hypothetical protein
MHVIVKAKKLLHLRMWRRRCWVMCKSVSHFEQTTTLTGMSLLFRFSCPSFFPPPVSLHNHPSTSRVPSDAGASSVNHSTVDLHEQ